MNSLSNKIIAVIVARLTSTRLPRKQLRNINGLPLIQHLVNRLRCVKQINQIILATGPIEENKDLADFLKPFNIAAYFDADIDDVTGRIARASAYFDAKYVVTVLGDCPLIDSEFISEGIDLLINNNADYVAVDKKKYQCLHEGIGIHTASAWEILSELSIDAPHKEHAGSIIHETTYPFKYSEIVPRKIFRRQDIRLSVDTQSDLDFMNRLYELSGEVGTNLKLSDVVDIVDKNQSTLKLNSHVHQKGVYERSKHFGFITYASSTIGLGHFSRCLALARELRESASAKITFFVNQDSAGIKKIEDADFPVSPWLDPQELGSLLATATQNLDISGLVIDLKGEDLNGPFAFLAELTFPQTIIDNWPDSKMPNRLHVIPSAGCMKMKLIPTHHNVFCGSEYIILNRDLNNLKWNQTGVETIIVTAGGSGNVPMQLISLLAELGDKYLTKFIIGPYSDAQSLNAAIEQSSLTRFEIIQNPSNIIEQFAACAFAFSIYGITSLELMALGVPQCIYDTVNPADINTVDKYVDDGALQSVWSFHEEDMVASLSQLIRDPEKLFKMSKRSRAAIDGRGVERTAQIIMNHVIRQINPN